MDFVLLAAGNWFYELWNGLWLLVCEGIYIFIGLLYQVFEKVASVNLFNAEIFEKITGRLYLIIGIAMLFIFAYNIILAIINPDGKDKGTAQLAKSVKETIISLVIVVLLPTIFNYLYVFQTNILESNIIGTVILGGAGSTAANSTKCEAGDYDCTCDFSTFNLDEYNNDIGWKFWKSTHTDMTSVMENNCKVYKKLPASQRGAYSIGPTVFSTFYRPANFTFDECASYLSGGSSANISSDEDKKICVNYFTDVVLSKYTGNIGPFVKDSYLKDIISDTNKDSMEFHWIMAVVAGVLAVYMFFCYSMEVGVRVAKLGFLQLISPIPVMLRIVPGQKEKVFDKWFTHLKNAYIDVFIRLAIIYFSLFGIGLVPDVINTMWDSVWDGSSISSNLITNFFVKSLVTTFVILGLLKFAQEAPALFKEFFGGGGGNFSLKSPRKQLQENKIAMGGIGAVAGGMQNMIGNAMLGGGVGSAIGGLIGGARRGAIHGYRTNDLSHLGGELRQAKYETDEARSKRLERKEYAAKKYGIEGPFAGMAGGFGQTFGNLHTYLGTDGSTKVAAAAAANVLNAFDSQESRFKKPNINNLDDRRRNWEELIEGAVTGTKVGFGGTTYVYDGSNWRVEEGRGFDITNPNDTIKNRLNEYIDKEKRVLYAVNYGKEVDVLKSSEEHVFRSLNENLSKLGPEFTETLLNKINNIPIYDANGISTGVNVSVNSIQDIQNKVTELINDGNLATVFEINDKMKSTVKAAEGVIRFNNAVKETKDKK